MSPASTSTRSEGPAATAGPRWIRRLLRVPLPYKILGANGIVVATTAVLTVLMGRLHASPVLAAGLAAAIGLAACIPVNWLLVRWALGPLRTLERTAGRIHAGDLEARAPHSPLADPQMRRLIQVFNDMLRRLASGQRMLRRLSIGVLDAAERERRSLAAELQEDAAQRLAALLLRVELARKALDGSSCGGESAARLEEAREEAVQSLETVRGLARRLHPPELGELGIVAALRAHGRAVSEQSGLPVEVLVSGRRPDLPPETALALYRIAEEALVNVVRHAEAHRIDIELQGADDRVVLAVRDDGRGFEPAFRPDATGGGWGLVGMRERARSVGGSLAVISAPRAGSRVVVSVPAAPMDGDGRPAV